MRDKIGLDGKLHEEVFMMYEMEGTTYFHTDRGTPSGAGPDGEIVFVSRAYFLPKDKCLSVPHASAKDCFEKVDDHYRITMYQVHSSSVVSSTKDFLM